ncbi:MAG: hypothetical protein ABUK19_00345, partial [Desulfobacteria bacterium]
FLTVAAKHCRRAEHSLQLVVAKRRSRLNGAAGFFNSRLNLKKESAFTKGLVRVNLFEHLLLFTP